MITTAASLNILAHLGRIALDEGFRPLDRADRSAFDGASDDAQIGFSDCDAFAANLCDALNVDTIATGKDALLVIVDGARIEIHASTADGEPVSLSMDLANAI